jgi:hypothetical protein
MLGGITPKAATGLKVYVTVAVTIELPLASVWPVVILTLLAVTAGFRFVPSGTPAFTAALTWPEGACQAVLFPVVLAKSAAL